jgi:hypothetical protein
MSLQSNAKNRDVHKLTSNTSSFCFLSTNSATKLCLPTFLSIEFVFFKKTKRIWMSFSDAIPAFAFLYMSVYTVSLESSSISISIHIITSPRTYIYTYIFYKPYSILYLCVTWPVKVNVCAVGLFYNLSVRRTLCFFALLCVVFVRLSSASKFLGLNFFFFFIFCSKFTNVIAKKTIKK